MLGYLDEGCHEDLSIKLTEISKMLFGLKKSITY